jgi:hypothetical protein
VSALPDDLKEKSKEIIKPKIEAAKNWYESQTPEQKRNLENI